MSIRRSSVPNPLLAGQTTWRWTAAWLVLALLIALLIVVPLVELFVIAWEEITRSEVNPLASAGTAALNSFWVATAVAILSIGFGAGSAFVTERSSWRDRRWLRVGILSSLFVPPFVSALSWLRAYGPSGLTDDLLGISLPGLLGPLGVVVVITAHALPISYLIVAAALNSSVNRERERAARVSGAPKARAIFDVTLPLLAPAMLGAGLLSFVIALNSFGVPAVLGSPARFSTVTTLIYQDLARSARPESFSRAIFLASVLAIGAVLISSGAELLLSRRRTEPRWSDASGPIAFSHRNGRWLTRAAWVMVTLFGGVPLLALILVALTRGVGLSPVPANWTLANFAEAISSRYLGALGRSLLLATTAAAVAGVLGTLAALVPKWERAVSAAVLLAFSVPGSTLAVAVLLTYGRPLRDTLALILIAYLTKLWAIGHRSVQGSVRGLAPEGLWAARAAGASSWRAVRTVLLPLLRPAILAGFVLVFLFAFHELTMSSLLYGPGTDTLAVAILNLQQIGDVPVSSALAVILTLPVLVLALPILLLGRLSRQSVGGG